MGILAKLPVPTLVFLDPCGYKGLSLKLVASALRGYGNDCIFFFNYSRINMKLDLEIMNRSIDEFFERDAANALRNEIQNRRAAEREGIIITAVKSAITQAGAIPLVFRFRSDQGRISHHLVYASKESRAANMMKSIMRSASSTISEGVGSGEHNPRDRSAPGLLFGGLYEVEERLLAVFAGREIRFDGLLREEAQTKYTEGNYRDALLNLERDGKITVVPPAEDRRFLAGRKKRSLPKTVEISFRS